MNAVLARTLSDEHLARRLGSGEAPAFDELYRRYAPRLTAYGARLLGDWAAGEDVAQIALFNAYRALCRGTELSRVRPWLYRIAQNAALEVLSRRRELETPMEPEERAEDWQEACAARGTLLAALRGLSDRQRRVLLLRELHGLRTSEIARELALGIEQVEQALFAARNRLAQELVFGERPGCETVRALDVNGLDRVQRRAVKGHLRSCPSCRAAVPRGRLELGVLPFGFLASLRDGLVAVLGGTGAPAAKVGAAVAAVALAAGPPTASLTAFYRDGHFRRAPEPAQAPAAASSEPAPSPSRHEVAGPRQVDSASRSSGAAASHPDSAGHGAPEAPPPTGAPGADSSATSPAEWWDGEPVAGEEPASEAGEPWDWTEADPADPVPEESEGSSDEADGWTDDGELFLPEEPDPGTCPDPLDCGTPVEFAGDPTSSSDAEAPPTDAAPEDSTL